MQCMKDSKLSYFISALKRSWVTQVPYDHAASQQPFGWNVKHLFALSIFVWEAAKIAQCMHACMQEEETNSRAAKMELQHPRDGWSNCGIWPRCQHISEFKQLQKTIILSSVLCISGGLWWQLAAWSVGRNEQNITYCFYVILLDFLMEWQRLVLNVIDNSSQASWN